MKEYGDFLSRQAPYDALDSADLHRLARRVEVEYFARGTMIVRADSEPLDRLYVVRTGSVEVLDRSRIVDLLGPGDTFGHVSLLTGLPPSLDVRAAEETLCYLLPDPRQILSHPDRLRFAHYGTLTVRERLADGGVLTDHASTPASAYARPLVWCDAGDRIADVARRISEARQSCAVVRCRDGFGIVTDSDFRRFVATGVQPPDVPVGGIATVPVVMITDTATVAETLLRMVEHDVHHLPVTDSQGRPSGVVRVVDMASAEVRDPLLIRSAVEHAADVPELASAARMLPSTAVALADAGLPALRLAALLGAVRDAIMRRLITIDVGIGSIGTQCSWMVLGSTARSEPFPGSDLDTAVAWPDGPAEPSHFGRIQAAAASRTATHP